MTKAETMLSKTELTETQRKILEKRLQQARQVSADPQERTSAIPRRGQRDNLPLSSAQQRLWFLDQLEPGSPVYNISHAVRMSGTLDVAALEHGLNEIIRRHESLRTNFVSVDGSPVQVIADVRTLSLEVHDLTAQPEARGDVGLRKMLGEEARRSFDLSADPLLRALLIRLGPREHVFMFTMHHIISDGWSLGVFFDELALFYEAAVTGEAAAVPELPVQYADFILWEKERLQGPALTAQLDYWKKQLRGSLPVLELPTDHPRRRPSRSRGTTKTLSLSSPLTQRLKLFGQREGATLFMTLLAAFQALLHRYTGQEDIVVGSVVAGRPQMELEKLIGFFVNTLVFRGNLSADPTFRELLWRIQETTMEALANQDLPFASLVEELRPDRMLRRNPLFQVMFVLQNTPEKPVRLPGLYMEPLEVETHTAKFDLMLSMMETADGLRAELEYNADLFEDETAERMLGHLQVLLTSIADDPDRKISELPLLTPGERHKVLIEWNRTYTPYPRDKTIARLFAEQAEQTPGTTAVVCGERSLTYRELDALTWRLAGRLRRCGVGPDVLVGVYLERSLELVVAVLAIIRAGGAYVSFDPTYPAERLGFMLAETKAPVIVTIERLGTSVASLVKTTRGEELIPTPTIIRLDVDSSEAAGDSFAWEPPQLTAENLAYVSYTSGSTGKPKGVCVTHRGVVRLVKNTNFARFENSDVFLQLAPVAFDASTLEVWAPLLNGGRLVVFPSRTPSLSGLGEFIKGNGITVLWLTAGLFHQMAEEHLGYLENVRLLLAGGDVLSVPHVARALQTLPRTRLVNGYGPTENTTFTCCHLITGSPSARRSVPIGRPVANTVVYILDAHRQPVPVGVPGELYTGGDGLARGYLREPELTAEKFILHPLADQPGERLYKTGDRVRWLQDGSIEFLGRIDRQVKIRGYRVEPAEIESALLEHPAVKDCVVVANDDPAGGKRLVAHLVAQATERSTPADWREHLKGKLPDHMVPAKFVLLDALPLSPNGKIDHSALRPPADDRSEPARAFTAPRDEPERRLAGLWEAVLGVSPISVHDRFFDLGGHSLLAVRLLSKIEKAFARKLPVSAVFQHPTVAQLGLLLRTPEIGGEGAFTTSLIGIQPSGSRPPLYLVHGVGGGMFWGYANLARHLGLEQPVHAFKSRGLDGLPEWPTIEEMARRYVADLRTFQPHGPYVLGGYCFGGNVAYEMACQLRTEGEETLVVLINSSPPHSDYESARFRWSVPWMVRFCRNLVFWLISFLLRWEPSERRDFIRWKLRLLRKKLTGWFRRRKADPMEAGVDEMVDLSAFQADKRRVWETHVRALIDHYPKAYDGRVVLFRSPGHLFLCSFDEQCGWSELVPGGITVKITPGDHSRILEEPFVATVATEMRRFLDEFTGSRHEKGGRT